MRTVQLKETNFTAYSAPQWQSVLMTCFRTKERSGEGEGSAGRAEWLYGRVALLTNVDFPVMLLDKFAPQPHAPSALHPTLPPRNPFFCVASCAVFATCGVVVAQTRQLCVSMWIGFN